MQPKTRLSNFHTHCCFDHGIGDMEEYCLKALSLGFSALGFSCHAPYGLQDGWHMQQSNIEPYFAEIQRMKELYGERLEIYAGLEMDYLETTGQLIGMEYRDRLDYTIASVHMIKHRYSDRYLTVDGPMDEFELLLNDNFKGDIQALATYYYHLEETLIERFPFDLLGHCDLIKKRNKGNRFFNQDEDWYRKLAFHMLQTAHEHGKRIEVNTGGLSSEATTEVYPSMAMLRRSCSLGIPVALSADAHKSLHIDFYFEQALQELKSAGYREIDSLSHGKWQAFPIV
ncbi:MAG: histidinol-phosphatase [Sphaerochaetaceae bacterium]